MSTGFAYRGAIGARLSAGGPMILWIGIKCFTGDTITEVTNKIDTFLEGK